MRYTEIRNAAIRIQNYWRGYSQRSPFLTQRRAAVCIQRKYRQLLMSREARLEFIRIREAVLSVQSAWRRYRHAEQNERRRKAGLIILRWYREFRQRKLEKLRNEELERCRKHLNTVIKLQVIISMASKFNVVVTILMRYDAIFGRK